MVVLYRVKDPALSVPTFALPCKNTEKVERVSGKKESSANRYDNLQGLSTSGQICFMDVILVVPVGSNARHLRS